MRDRASAGRSREDNSRTREHADLTVRARNLGKGAGLAGLPRISVAARPLLSLTALPWGSVCPSAHS